jgi:hypothetical protein
MPRNKGHRNVVLGVSAGVALLAIALGANRTVSEEPGLRKITRRAPPVDTIAEDDPADYPKTVALIGRESFPLAQGLKKQVAWDVANRPQCDRLAQVFISQERSSLNDVHFVADCENGYRARFSENEARALLPPGPSIIQ